MAGRTNKEWREDNRKTLLHSKKEHYEKNKEHQSDNVKKMEGSKRRLYKSMQSKTNNLRMWMCRHKIWNINTQKEC